MKSTLLIKNIRSLNISRRTFARKVYFMYCTKYGKLQDTLTQLVSLLFFIFFSDFRSFIEYYGMGV